MILALTWLILQLLLLLAVVRMMVARAAARARYRCSSFIEVFF